MSFQIYSGAIFKGAKLNIAWAAAWLEAWSFVGIEDQRKARTLAERNSRVPGVLVAAANAGGPLRIEFDRRITDESALRGEVGRCC